MNELKERRDAAAKKRDMRILKCGVAGGRRKEGGEKGKREGRGEVMSYEFAAGGMPGLGGAVGLRKKRRRRKGERGLINQCEIGASVACSHSTTHSL